MFKKGVFFFFVLLAQSGAFAASTDFIGTWTRTGGDLAWVRIAIDKNMQVSGYRSCGDNTPCGDPISFQMTTYGRTAASSNHNKGTGFATDPSGQFTGTEILEIDGDALTLTEYQNFNPSVGAPNIRYQMTFSRVSKRR